jgi:hypothetical protein
VTTPNSATAAHLQIAHGRASPEKLFLDSITQSSRIYSTSKWPGVATPRGVRLRAIGGRQIVKPALIFGLPLLRFIDDSREFLDRIDSPL